MATLIYVDSGEIKASGIDLRDSMEDYEAGEMLAQYDDYGNEIGDSEIAQELELNGLIGMKKISNKTLKLSFDDGDVFCVNIKPSKMASVMEQIGNKAIRKSNKRIIGY